MKKKKNHIYVLVCTISIILAILITYKITNPTIDIPKPNIQEYPVSQSKYLNEQKRILDNISNNFNNELLIKKYITNNANIKATVEGNTIVIDYQENSKKEQFIFILDDDKLNITINKDKIDIFNNIFKLMIEANQKRLANKNDLSNFFSKSYQKDNMITKSTIIINNNDSIEYIININIIIN